MKKFKGIAIDADYLIFECTEDKMSTGKMFAEEGGLEDDSFKKPLKQYKQKFKRLVCDVQQEIYGNLPGQVGSKLKILFSDPNGNFRYDINPDYKGNRKAGSRSKTFYRFRKWANKKYGYIPNIEADDACGHYAKKGYVIATFDKDVKSGVEGTFFDVYHARRYIVKTTKEEAMRFNLIQTLSGDPTDNILGLPRVAHKTAIALLNEFGWNWEGVVKAYESKGLTEKDAIYTRQQTCVQQWCPKKGLVLYGE